MKKILSILLVVAMVACMSVSVFAADTKTEFVKVASYDFSNTTGLKGFTAEYKGENKCNAAAAEVADGVIVDGKYVMGTMGFIVDKQFDATKGIKVTLDVTLDTSKIAGSPWVQGIVTIVNPDGKAADLFALTGEEFEHSYDAYNLNLQGGGKAFQQKTTAYNADTGANDAVWGGDGADLVSAEESVKTFAVEMIVVPTESGADYTLKVDGETMPIPNGVSFANYLSNDMIVMLGGSVFGDYPANVTVDNVNIYTMQEVEQTTNAPQTGVATIALAVVAMLSGAYVVSKKH